MLEKLFNHYLIIIVWLFNGHIRHYFNFLFLKTKSLQQCWTALHVMGSRYNVHRPTVLVWCATCYS